MTGSAEAYRVEFMPPSPIPEGGQLYIQWESLLATSNNLFFVYQSPEWWNCLLRIDPQRAIGLLLLWDATGNLCGVAPLQHEEVTLGLGVGRHSFGISKLHCTGLLGGRPLVPENQELQSRLLSELVALDLGCVALYLKSVPCGSACWQLLEGSRWRIGRSIAYCIEGPRDFAYITLPEEFEEYLSRFRQKQRYNLKRQVRLLLDACSGELNLRVITQPEETVAFISAVGSIWDRSWKRDAIGTEGLRRLQDSKALMGLAEHGLLRAYVLETRKEPLAFVLGYQYRDVYHYADIGYDCGFAKHSPGTGLLYLIIRDLIDNTHLRRVNLGIGDSDYKRFFADQRLSDGEILIMRQGWQNAFSRNTHRVLRMAETIAKRVCG